MFGTEGGRERGELVLFVRGHVYTMGDCALAIL